MRLPSSRPRLVQLSGPWMASTLLALTLSVPATAQEVRPEAPSRLALIASRGAAVEVNGSELVDIDTIFVRYTRVVGHGKRILGGEPSWGVEAGLLSFDQDPSAVGFGVHVLYEHRFAPHAAVHPLLDLGAGALLADEKVPPGETAHNFSLLAGLGLEIRLTDRGWLRVGYRFHHVSNADTGVRNPGINSHTMVAALVLGL